MAAFTRTVADFVGTMDSLGTSPSYLSLPRRIVLRNVSSNAMIVDAQDSTNRGFMLPGASAAGSIKPGQTFEIPIEAYLTLSNNTKARFAAMARAGLLSATDVAMGSVSGTPLDAIGITTVS